jgi:hypothetical protein
MNETEYLSRIKELEAKIEELEKQIRDMKERQCNYIPQRYPCHDDYDTNMFGGHF